MILDIAPLPAGLETAYEQVLTEAIGEFDPPPRARLITRHIALFADLRRRGVTQGNTTRPNPPQRYAPKRGAVQRVWLH